MRALLILNPTAGGGRVEATEKAIRRAFSHQSVRCKIALTRKIGDGTHIAREAAGEGWDAIIAGGGDGTVNEVANGLAGAGVPMGILPLGTVNVLARELKIPMDADGAVGVIANGRVKYLDLGCANGRYFTLMAGLGFDAEVVASIVQPLKDIMGASAYVLTAVETLARYRPTDVVLEMPGNHVHRCQAYLVVVANSSDYGYRLKVTPHASPDDGLLDVIVFERPRTDRIGFVRQILEVFIRRHIYHKAVRYFKVTSVSVRSDPSIHVQLDGDPFGITPVDITIVPRALPVIVPNSGQ
jgi:YegS/Rv2252/BmrU family lipid kinase